jgi:hypothetical protein
MLIVPPRIGVVILNFNSARDTLGCLASLRRAEGGERCVWVVDNGSTDGSGSAIPPSLQDSEVWLPLGSNFGYAAGNNAGIRAALEWGAAYVLILNPDVRVSPDFLPPLVRALEGASQAGAACPLVLSQDGETVQSLGGESSLWTGRCRRRLFGEPASSARSLSWLPVDFPHGACMLLKRQFLEEVGFLNEAYFLYYEDVELGLRANRDLWDILAIPQSRVTHSDTTQGRASDPSIVFYATRNQAWVVAEYGSAPQRLCFLTVSAAARWPLKMLSFLVRGRFKAAGAVFRGAWAGLFSRAWRHGTHLAIPLKGRAVAAMAPP